MPVTLDGLKLTGGGTATADTTAGTIVSSRSVRWSIGRVQIRRARFAWTWTKQLAFAARGGVRGLDFSGNGVLRFTGANGGTATFRATVVLKALAGTTVSGDAVLTVGRKRAFDVRKVHVRVGELALERLLLRKLDFRYSNSAWSAGATVRLPAFTIANATVGGHIEVANGRVRDIRIKASGLESPTGTRLCAHQGRSLRQLPSGRRQGHRGRDLRTGSCRSGAASDRRVAAVQVPNRSTGTRPAPSLCRGACPA